MSDGIGRSLRTRPDSVLRCEKVWVRVEFTKARGQSTALPARLLKVARSV